MRSTFKPMLVSAGPLRPDSDDYAFEVKWDGFRTLVRVDGAVTVTSRKGHDMTSRYPELQDLVETVANPVVLDGELVVLGAEGRPDFAALWFRSRTPKTQPAEGTLCLMVFDVLRVGDRDLIELPYSQRRRILEDLGLTGPHWCTPDSHVGQSAALFAATRDLQLEGVVAKRVDSRYRPGIRSRSWVKTKHFQTKTFSLLGWLPPHEWRGDRGCVALGVERGGAVAFVGVVETGYGRGLVEQLPQLTRNDLRGLADQGVVPPTDGGQLMADVKYLEWSSAGGLRHATLVMSSVR